MSNVNLTFNDSERGVCPICMIPDSARSLAYPCMHAFCEGCIHAHTSTSVHCPICRQVLVTVPDPEGVQYPRRWITLRQHTLRDIGVVPSYATVSVAPGAAGPSADAARVQMSASAVRVDDARDDARDDERNANLAADEHDANMAAIRERAMFDSRRIAAEFRAHMQTLRRTLEYDGNMAAIRQRAIEDSRRIDADFYAHMETLRSTLADISGRPSPYSRAPVASSSQSARMLQEAAGGQAGGPMRAARRQPIRDPSNGGIAGASYAEAAASNAAASDAAGDSSVMRLLLPRDSILMRLQRLEEMVAMHQTGGVEVARRILDAEQGERVNALSRRVADVEQQLLLMWSAIARANGDPRGDPRGDQNGQQPPPRGDEGRYQ